ncbi:hypothetical protein EXIGLDRAFT_754237 [Exidia glandulosa HHB12029]|uniref:Uncharacterized protein n=1 Tax=Exidia glandulosa HHB12029 TaxID=1314781 RepID=A0A165D402_EXIGL|nr:hypothetical protein EXIGLDRAFT_754237 [Exidia glandulosa HHB12029]
MYNKLNHLGYQTTRDTDSVQTPKHIKQQRKDIRGTRPTGGATIDDDRAVQTRGVPTHNARYALHTDRALAFLHCSILVYYAALSAHLVPHDWSSCNGKSFRPQNLSRHLRSAHKAFACTPTGCERTFKDLDADEAACGRKRGGVKMEFDTDEDEWLSALSEDEDEDEPTPAPPAKRRSTRSPRSYAPRESSNSKERSREHGHMRAQLQVAEKKIKALQKQLADMRKTAKATATVAETSTAAKMEQRVGEDEWTMWVDADM